MSPRPARALLAVLVVATLVMAGCGDSDDGGGGSTTLALVAFAAPKAGHDLAQEALGETPAGEGISWRTSYGASGDQSRAVVSGLDTDLVHFSLESDITRLVDEGLVAEGWNSGETKGIITGSVVVLVVRKGNPKGIEGWDDIVQPDVGIVTPNPGSSGSARWNILAAWAHVIAGGGSEADAEAYLTEFFENTVALPGSGRDATTAFTGGTGDVLISYENEAILARQHGEDFDYIIPDETLLIENPAAVLADADPRAQDYLDFVLSEAGQAQFAKVGFRPVIDGVKVGEVEGARDPSDPFPTVAQLLTIDDFGGWSDAADKFFDEQDGLVTRIQHDAGKA